MEKERNYDNDGLDPSEEYFKKKEKGMMIPIFLKKNQNHHIIKHLEIFDIQFTLEGINTFFFNVH